MYNTTVALKKTAFSCIIKLQIPVLSTQQFYIFNRTIVSVNNRPTADAPYRGILNEVLPQVNKHFKADLELQINTKRQENIWAVNGQIKWPVDKSFERTSATKKVGIHLVSKDILEFLRDEQILSDTYKINKSILKSLASNSGLKPSYLPVLSNKGHLKGPKLNPNVEPFYTVEIRLYTPTNLQDLPLEALGIDIQHESITQEVGTNNTQTLLPTSQTDDSGCDSSKPWKIITHHVLEKDIAKLSQLLGEDCNFRGILMSHCSLVAKEFDNPHWGLQEYHDGPLVALHQTLWGYTCKLYWPQEVSFSVTQSKKMAANKLGVQIALHWLHLQGKLQLPGTKKVGRQSGEKEVPAQLGIEPEFLSEIEDLSRHYQQHVKPIISMEESMLESSFESTDELTLEPSLAGSLELPSDSECSGESSDLCMTEMSGYDSVVSRRNDFLYNQLQQRLKKQESQLQRGRPYNMLPIAKYREQLLKLTDEHQVLVLTGEPGCGKSTQLVQFVFDEWCRRMKGGECSIIVGEPRRFSATTLAHRVSHERAEQVGNVVGYNVRFNRVLPSSPHGAILFCTNGVLLRKLENDPALSKYSHVFLDEAHERSVEVDMLLWLLRRALGMNPELRLVVMSATINTKLFQDYFSNAPAFHIEGLMFPVKQHFLDDLSPKLLSKGVLPLADISAVVDVDLVSRVVVWIEMNKPPGAILVFLPGWAEIAAVCRNLSEQLDPDFVFPVHSRLTHTQQARMFEPAPPGIRKVILATNIAETGITIDDVVYVVDSGTQKEARPCSKNGISKVELCWLSKASVQQRQGRAGRVQPGESFHLLTREQYGRLSEFSIPEMWRVPLDKVVLDSKTLGENMSAAQFCSELPQPPFFKAVERAVIELQDLEVIDDMERLTALGRRISKFTLPPRLSKILIHGAIYRCTSPILTITMMLSEAPELFTEILVGRKTIRETKARFHPSSDHVAVARLYEGWQDSIDFCRKNGVSIKNIKLYKKLRSIHANQLYECGILLRDRDQYKEATDPCNRFAGNNEMLKGVLLSGMNQVLRKYIWDQGNTGTARNDFFLTENGSRVYVASESVNYHRKKFGVPYAGAYQLHSREKWWVTAGETSLVTPMTVFLFKPGQLSVQPLNPKIDVVDVGKWTKPVRLVMGDKSQFVVVCEEREAEMIMKLKDMMTGMTSYFIEKGWTNDEDGEMVQAAHDKLLTLVSKLLKEPEHFVNP